MESEGQLTQSASLISANRFLQGLNNGSPYNLYKPNEMQSSKTGAIIWEDNNIAIQRIDGNNYIAHNAKIISQAVAAASITAQVVKHGIRISYCDGKVTADNPYQASLKKTSSVSQVNQQADSKNTQSSNHILANDKDRLNGVKRLLLRVVFDGYDYALLLNYFEGISGVMKIFQGKYIGEKGSALYRAWRVSKQIIDQQISKLYLDLVACAGEGFNEPSVEFFAQIEAARLNPDASAFTAGLKERIYSIQSGGIAIIGTYHPKVIAIVKNMGGRYLPSMKAWMLTGVSPAVLKNNLLTDMFLQDDQIEIVEGVYSIVEDALFKAEHEDTARIHTLNNAEAEPVDDAGNEELGDGDVFLAVMTPLTPSEITRIQVDRMLAEYSLYDFQPDGIWHLVSKTSALLGDDMGLGKSRQAAVAANILLATQPDPTSCKLLVICPASLIINWTREIAMIDPGALIATQQWDDNAKWIVTNYEQMEKMVSYAKRFLVMIIDEAHLLKEVTAKRTRIAFDIAAKVPYRFILTGTPILNRESEIHTLLRLSGHPVGNIPLRQFEKEFAGDPTFRRELNKRISEWMLRRTKEAVLKTLKGKQRQVHFVSVSDQQRAEYDLIANDGTLLALPKITRLRQKLESIKIDSTLEMFSEMQADDKVLIFCEYRDTVVELKRRFDDLDVKTVTLVGTDSNNKRQKAIDSFQDDPNVRVFIGTTGAAGVGNNLTAANYVIFASLPWTPALKNQAEDRAYRNGQTRLVIVKIPLMEDTIDIDLWEMLKHKHQIAVDILDTEEAEEEAIEEFALSLNIKAAQRAVPNIAKALH